MSQKTPADNTGDADGPSRRDIAPKKDTSAVLTPSPAPASAELDDATAWMATPSSSGGSGSNTPPQIGRYQILERVGRGGMGVLYRGIDPVLDREVAIKLMLGDFSDDYEQLRPRFYREARAVAKLQHRNIVTVFEFAEDGTTPY